MAWPRAHMLHLPLRHLLLERIERHLLLTEASTCTKPRLGLSGGADMQLKQLCPEAALHLARAPLRQAAPSSRQFASHRASRSRRIRCVASLPFAKASERFLTTRSVRRCSALALAAAHAHARHALARPTRFLHAIAPQHLSVHSKGARCPARFAQRPAPLSTQPSVLCTSVRAQSTSFVAVKRIALCIMSRGSSSRSIKRHFVKRSFSKMDLRRSTTSPTASECSTTERASTPSHYLIGPKMASRTPQRRCAADDKSVWGGPGLMKPSPQLSLLGGWPAHLMAGLISSPDGRAHQLT